MCKISFLIDYQSGENQIGSTITDFKVKHWTTVESDELGASLWRWKYVAEAINGENAL